MEHSRGRGNGLSHNRPQKKLAGEQDRLSAGPCVRIPSVEEKYRPHWESLSDHESLEMYLRRVCPNCHAAERHFFGHVLYDHFDNFEWRFPWFDPAMSEYCYHEATAGWIRENVRSEYDPYQWDFQYDGQADDVEAHTLPDLMLKILTWPVEPVVLHIKDLHTIQSQQNIPLHPFHLVEGTRRLNFLFRMLEDETIPVHSKHRFVVVTPRM